MRTRNASTTFHRVSKLANSVFQKTDSKKHPLRFSATFWRVDPLRVFAALLAVFFIASSNYIGSHGNAVAAFTESISTFASSDCATPKSEWDLGQTVCAVVTGAPNQQRIVWIAPDGGVAQVSSSFTGTGTDSYTLPTGTNPLAQYGTWKVEGMDNAGVGFVVTTFLVRPENTASTDLAVLDFGPLQAVAGNNITYTVQLTNQGPDTAQNVVLSASAPNDSTFVAEAQNSGPTASCTNPSGSTTTCTIPSLAANETATFTFIYNVNSGTPVDTVITNTVSVSSSTQELFQINNTASSLTSVVDTPSAPPCTISCPTNISTTLNDPNLCSVVVTYATPGLSGSCTDPDTGQTPTVVCSPPSGATFPAGTTTVVCAAGGTACGFTVTVQDTRPPVALTLTCPANVTATENADGSGSATVNYPAPTTTGNCVTVSCDPPSGTVFFVGTTPVTCTAQDSANNTTSCSFTVTVNADGGGGCTITCPGDITRTASAGQCSAAVTFADPTTSGSCSAVTCKDQNNTVRHSGDSFPVGSTFITCTTSEGASCDFTITVISASPPTITTCASNKTISANSACEAAIPNLVSGVVATGCSVSISQSPAAGTIVGIGPVTVTITAENSAGETTCTAIVTVVENTPPVITTCPAASSASANSTCQAAVPNVLGGVTASDNCTPTGSLVISQSPAAGTLVGAGITTITVTVRDLSGNTSTCTTTFTVNDITPPTITTCPANRNLSTNGGNQVALPNLTGEVVASDACTPAGSLVITQSPAAGTMLGLGATTVTVTVKDAANNQSTCIVTVTVYRYLVKDFVAFSSESTKLATNVSVHTGNVGANTSLPDPNGPPDDQVEVELGVNAKMLQAGSSVLGDTVKLGVNSQVYNVYYNESQFSPLAHILGNQVTPQPLPVSPMPAFPTVTPGTTDVTVGINQTQTLGPGSYRNITVQTNGKLILSGGLYQVASLNIGTNAKVFFLAASEVRIKNQMTGNANAVIGPDASAPSLQASQIVFYVEGADSSSLAVELGTNNTVKANIYAPNGTVWLKTSTNATGAFIGKQTRFDTNVELTLKSAF